MTRDVTTPPSLVSTPSSIPYVSSNFDGPRNTPPPTAQKLLMFGIVLLLSVLDQLFVY